MENSTSQAAKRVKLDIHNPCGLPGDGLAMSAEDTAAKLLVADGEKDTVNEADEIETKRTMDNGESAEKPPELTEEVARELLEYF